MLSHRSLQRVIPSLGLAVLLGATPWMAGAETPSAAEQLLLDLDSFPHARRVDTSRQQVVDYEVGLGAMQKHLGDWQFKRSQRLDGERLRFSWQIVDGFSSAEVFDGLTDRVAQLPGSELLFECEGRACGNGARWANQVFSQRVLYGRAEAQRYRAYRITGDTIYYLLAYASARTSDRQYLHAEVLTLASDSQGSSEQ
jgi:hypothetical protein